MDVVYLFYENSGVRIPFFDYDADLFSRLCSSRLGHWDNPRQQYVIASGRGCQKKQWSFLAAGTISKSASP
jgi:hypothetical protein